MVTPQSIDVRAVDSIFDAALAASFVALGSPPLVKAVDLITALIDNLESQGSIDCPVSILDELDLAVSRGTLSELTYTVSSMPYREKSLYALTSVIKVTGFSTGQLKASLQK